MKKLTQIVISIILLSSCATLSTTETIDVFSINQYKGNIVVQKLYEDFPEEDWYIIRNDSSASQIRVPSWFGSLYSEGDTIK